MTEPVHTEPVHAEGPTCTCGCVLAAWSMPWPVETAPWSPAVVHDTAPQPNAYTLATHDGSDAAAVTAPDRMEPDLIDTDLFPDRRAS